jgi:Ca-activated chloride channel family protein
MVPLLRVAALGVLAWGFLVLLQIDRAIQEGRKEPAAKQDEPPLHHLVIGLDVSPSMHLKDAGMSGQEARGEQARDLVRSVLERLDLRSTRLSIIAFYSDARPVVVDTSDPEVVHNILNDLPLEHAFAPARTDLYSAVRSSAELGRKWEPGTATLLLVSDGDTLPAREIPPLPVSFGGVLVVGVGDPHRGLYLDGHLSRQEVDSLRRLALRLGGLYHDGNRKHLPTEVLSRACRSVPARKRGPLHRKELAVLAVGAGAALLAFLAPLLAFAGAPTVTPGGRRQ